MMGNEAPRTGGGGGPSTPPPRLRTGEPSTPRTPVECPYEFALDGEGGDEPARLGAGGGGGLYAGGGLGGGGAAAPMDTRRTAEAIAAGPLRGTCHADRNGLAFRGLPQGPWLTRKQARDAFVSLLKVEGHKLNESTTRPASKARGAEQTLVCSYGVKPRESKARAKADGGRQSSNFHHANADSDILCQWKIVIEESNTGWVIKSAVLEHCAHPERSKPRELSAAELDAMYSLSCMGQRESSCTGTVSMADYTLYSLEGSGNSLKARLLLDFLGLKYETIVPNVHPADAAFLKLNPLGQVPVLVEAGSGLTICDSAAILIFLCTKHAKGTHWYPADDPLVAANIAKWMAYAGHEVTNSLLWVRIKNKFSWDIPVEYDYALERSRKTLAFLDAHLKSVVWFAATPEPTIADIAIFPYVALCESSSSDALQLAEYPAVQRWVARFKALPNCHPMPPF